MYQEFIVVRGARENNLRDVSVRIPKRKISVFVGVSGSGKSSLVFDTVAAEAQRQLNETFSAFVRGFLPQLGHPEADLIENLSTAVIVDQKRLGGNSRSTVGTITDINPLLRLMVSRVGTPHVGPAYMFGFNDPSGMCPDCSGIGKKMEVQEEKFFDRTKSLNEGAILAPGFGVGTWYWKVFADSGAFDNDKPLADYSPAEWELLRHGSDSKVQLNVGGVSFKATFEGVVTKFTRLVVNREDGGSSTAKRDAVKEYTTTVPCPACKGTRLNPTVLSSTIDGYSIADLTAMDLAQLAQVIRSIDEPEVAPVVEAAVARIQSLVSIGLGYLTLDRETTTLSGGESQRIKMVRYLGSSLADVMYVFDEPSIGLHPRDVHRLNELLIRLRDKGNTVLVVEHDPDVITIADHVVELGPRAGTHGGEIMYEGDVTGLRGSGTLTGSFLHREPALRSDPRTPAGHLPIAEVTSHNLRGVSVDVPLGVLVAITGVAGSGKSTLMREGLLAQHPDVIFVDQSGLSTSIRSTPSTYTGMMDPIRKLFAKTNGVSPSLFSFNSKGACQKCQGIGVLYTDLIFMDGVRTPCDECDGKRFTDEVLGYTVDGRTISDVLNLSTEDALEHFTARDIRRRLQSMVDVGLGYITLGQPLSTLSGGECQRLKLATELHRSGNIYVLDEPTTGLHMSDCGHLLSLLDKIVDNGSSVIVIEHNLDVVAHADWVIDLGPDGGDQGGRIVFEGTPTDLLSAPGSFTGEHLRRHLEAAAV